MNSKTKKILTAVLAVAMVAVLAIGTTLAYLQDTDSATNVMTVGNVEIEQIEQEWNDSKTELVDFTQGKLLMPYVGELAWENMAQEGGAYRRFTMENVLDKYVSVKNTGNQPAYVRTWIALEMGEYTSIEEYKYNVIGYSYNDANGASGSRKWIWSAETVAQIGGKNYLVRYATHEDPVAAGDTTIPSLLQVYMGKNVDNAEVAKLDGNGNGTFDILAFSQGVQSQGFNDAVTAVDAAFGTTMPWTADDIETPALVADEEELADALAAGKDVTLTDDVVLDKTVKVTGDVTINLNGNDLSSIVSNEGKAAAIIDNRGTLEITGNGTLDFVAEDPDLQAIPSYATNTITNEGTLVIGEGVVIKNGSDGGASYAVDNKGVFIMNGGELIGNRCALRVAKYNQDNVYFEMNGGTITAQTPAWIQLPGSQANVSPTITVVINDGVIKSTKTSSADNDVLYTYTFGNSFENTKVTINGGQFLGGTVSFGASYVPYSGALETVAINGGKFDYDVLRWSGSNSEVIYNAN